MEYTDVKITVPWGHLAGRWYGDRKVRPILALHGWLDNLGTWNRILPLLPKHLGILCIDFPGHGHSSNLPIGIMYNALVFLDMITLVMREFNWAKVSLLGHSMGGRTAFVFATVFPERVDIIMLIDVAHHHIYPPDTHIRLLHSSINKFFIEDERLRNINNVEPPSYTHDELKRIMFEGSVQSIEPENSHHIYERNIKKSRMYPNKFFFTRDGRIKWYIQYIISTLDSAVMASRIDMPLLVIKASKSTQITAVRNEIVDFLGRNNSLFEIHEVKGTHHIHLNNAPEVADILTNFIYRYRPPKIMNGEIRTIERKKIDFKRSKL